MADNVTIPATGSGDATPVVATDQDASAPNAHYQLMKAVWGPLNTFNIVDTASGKPMPVQLRGSAGGDLVKLEDGASNDADPGMPVLAVQKATPANTAGTDGDYEFLQISAGGLWVRPMGKLVTVTTSITRPADTTAYTANDNWADSTSAPTTGGFTFTGMSRASGGAGIITDVIVVSSIDPATLLRGELWIYDSAVTAVNDNAAFASSDSDTLLLIGIVPFTMASVVGGSATTSWAHIQNLAIGYTCVGTANLRFKVKVINAYTPASAEVLSFRVKAIQVD